MICHLQLQDVTSIRLGFANLITSRKQKINAAGPIVLWRTQRACRTCDLCDVWKMRQGKHFIICCSTTHRISQHKSWDSQEAKHEDTY